MDKQRLHLLPGNAIRQERGRRSYDALIATGFKLLEKRTFESITVAEVASIAGYSVGAFYARFRSKDEFFDALLADHLRHRKETRERLLRTLSNDELIHGFMDDLVAYYWTRRWFWRAALIRSIRDPKPLRGQADEVANALTVQIDRRRGRSLTREQKRNLRHALQIALGAVNNMVIYNARPAVRGRRRFVADLVRTFRLISDYETLLVPRS